MTIEGKKDSSGGARRGMQDPGIERLRIGNQNLKYCTYMEMNFTTKAYFGSQSVRELQDR